jgi:diguanylate cyclase (GGDEF)-like protein/PAS domain S-box-containing protein
LFAKPVTRHAYPVLCVEDDAPTLRVLAKLLESRFDRVITARDGLEGLDLFRQHRPGLVITDIVMPNLDGISMAREIRAQAPSARIIITTSHGGAELLLAAIEIGVTDYLLKPLSAERVYAAIDKCLRLAVLERQLRDAMAETENVLECIRDAFFALDQDWRFTCVNRKAEAMFNLPRARLLGRSLPHLLPGGSAARQQFQMAMQTQERTVFQCFTPGLDLWHEARVFPLEGGISVHLQDITEVRKAREEIHFLAFHDRLTSLPNRTLLQDRVLRSLKRCRDGGHQGAILSMDLDRFKHINDALGHDTGDRVLQEAARRLATCVRDCDTVARAGGDEFVVLLDGIEHASHVHWVLERITSVLAQDIPQDGVPLSLTASIGVSLIPGDGDTVEGLLRAADDAKDYSKKRGGNGFQFYSPRMEAEPQGRLVLRNALGKPFRSQDFTVEFQPRHSLASGALEGFEALAGWHHPDLGAIPAGDFIPLAEETGLILPLGAWVLETACRLGRAWADQHGAPLRMAVNISGRQFWQGDLVDTVFRTLAATGFPPTDLELEFTESMVMNDVDLAITTMQCLAAMGIRMAIDGFGTHGTLASLRKFPVQALRIDRSLVKGAPADPDDRAITKAIVDLAHTLKLDVVAMGVEGPDQLEALRGMGCDSGQGFYFSPPLDARDVGAMLLRA